MSTANMTIPCMHLRLSDNQNIQGVLYGYIVPFLSFLGSFGSFLSFATATDQNLKASTYIHIAFLTFFNGIALLAQSLFMVCLVHFHSETWAVFTTAYFLWPIYDGSTTLSLTLMMANTVHRYFYVLNVSSNGAKFILSETKPQTVWKVCVFCVIIIAIDAPRMMLMKVRDDIPTCLWFRWSSHSDYWYWLYTLIRFFVLNIGCIIILAIFNCLLIGTTKHQWNSYKRKLEQRQLTVALIIAASIYLIGEMYSVLFNPVTETLIWQPLGIFSLNFLKSGGRFTFVLLLLEYCSNWIILLALSRPFQKVLFDKFFDCVPCNFKRADTEPAAAAAIAESLERCQNRDVTNDDKDASSIFQCETFNPN